MKPIPFDLVWGAAKVFVLFGMAIYGVFALVVIRQVHQMTKTIAGSLTGLIMLVSYLHLAAAIGLFLAALVIL
ncbi:hypothetical protein A3B57_02520 [Microgenomates group bacterium RIFCSPLOWO2_01_FULL_47_10]|nr:MAG: hypothetical protein A3B57_02520 [Microgenomates group bacterium RIFCSPLOWO2_01_FULL_47_10]